MKRDKAFKELMKYRKHIMTYGKMVAFDNPDKLGIDELEALIARIFEELNKIDMSLGYEYHDTGLKAPDGVSRERQEELFINFIDWYKVIQTPNSQVYDYVMEHYPKEKYPRILCVGDGENCHLGRMLAAEGYHVVSVDPVARRELSGATGIPQISESKGGKFKVVQAEFYKDSTDMIDWASVIVGSKIPQCAEQLIGLKKPTVFNISKNAEIHNMKFRGTSIKSSEQLTSEIAKCSGVKLRRTKLNDEEPILFICDPREREDR